MQHVQVQGPDSAPATVVLAHGAGSGLTHPFLDDVAAGLEAGGLRVVRFDFPWRRAMAEGAPRPPDRLPVLQQCLRDVVAAHAHGSALVLAGKSLGGRVATTLADELAARAVVVFGYPFHPPRRPQQLRTEHLATLRTPTLILQGERDPFGTRQEVEGYSLSPSIQLQWFADGDHSLAPRKRSGFTAEQHLRAALQRALAFVHAALVR